MTVAKLVWRNAEQFRKDLGRADETRTKAARVACKVEGFRLMKELKKEIRAGAPGGRPFSPLTLMARYMRRPRNRKPLSRLAVPVRYRAGFKGDQYIVSVGYLTGDISNPNIRSRNRISRSWARIVEWAQKGGRAPITAEKRREILKEGIYLKSRKKPASRVFFLRKSTQFFRTPARPIIDPFWAAHRREAQHNIKANFERKMAGHRI